MFLTSLLASITSVEEQTPSEEAPDSEDSPLDNVSTKRTVSDVIDHEVASNALPGNWKLKYDLTVGDSNNLTEIAVIHHPSQLVEYHLEPVETYEPLEDTRVSVEHANSMEEHLTTTAGFKAGCKAVVQQIKQLEDRTEKPSEADWNSASPDEIQGPNPNRSPASV
ncbi:hypothetical protein [Halosimplex pelagicum]|uniref:Uncharacterized protein n=1 Tax=Halosimplex pelagicum TaxID=869886 RepID=A0A7D5P6P7_9EURY|nr:hypothetical protein [Halosimplex pelagicum]QLH82217.1 hypothetical protein HZS54_11625 [Halosimplex pelagicum]